MKISTKIGFTKSFIRDLFIKGLILTLQYLQETKKVKCKFLIYETLKKKICKLVNDRMITDPIVPLLPYSLETIDIGGKG